MDNIEIIESNFEQIAIQCESMIRGIIAVTLKKYQNHYGLEFDDLRQVALMALWRAVKIYKDDKGMKFTTFATTLINQRFVNYTRDYLPCYHKTSNKLNSKGKKKSVRVIVNVIPSSHFIEFLTDELPEN
jgi:DNA-directed RNA polymerase specialized sigma subunit